LNADEADLAERCLDAGIYGELRDVLEAGFWREAVAEIGGDADRGQLSTANRSRRVWPIT
jgi:hypothetical protein